jgi:membrane associated rhomboid family serine protease
MPHDCAGASATTDNGQMIIPWGTDAPIYHRPFATIALIAINVLLFFVIPGDAYDGYVLVVGDGVRPVQWLTNNFLHSGFFHLAGNMIFLWTFGFVVEGKLGWVRFLIIYLLLGVSESAAMQLLLPSEHEVSMLGSSTIVFGLMGMCLVWAPRNEVTCIVWLRFTPMEFDLSILWFAAMYIALDVFTGGLSGILKASITNLSPGVIIALELDHTFGAILGILVGAAMLKLGWVDCENWDIFAVLGRRTGKPKSREPRTRKSRRLVSSEYRTHEKSRSKRKDKGRGAEPSGEDRSGIVLQSLRRHLELGETEAALAVYHKARRSPSGWQPPERDWRDLIEALIEVQAWDASLIVMRDYIRELAEPSPRVRLKLAQILMQKQGRPQQALKVLGQIRDGSLPANLESIRQQLLRHAEAMREDGPLELDEDLL